MEAQARGAGVQLRHQHIDVAAQHGLQNRLARQFAAKSLGLDAPREAGALHNGVQGRSLHAQGELRAQHALKTHHADFQAGFAVNGRHQGDKTLHRKINVPGHVAGLAQHIGRGQCDPLGEEVQARPVWSRQQR